jgi:hypothetical protein
MASKAPLEPPDKVGLVLRLHWRACLDGAILPDGPPSLSFERPDVQRLGRDRLFRMFFGPDPRTRFWLRERAYLTLLCVLALHSRWLGERPQPLSIAMLARQSGLSERMVRLTLAQGITAGDLEKGVPEANRRQRHYDLTPRLIRTVREMEDGRTAAIAQGIGRLNPHLTEPALLAPGKSSFAGEVIPSRMGSTPTSCSGRSTDDLECSSARRLTVT